MKNSKNLSLVSNFRSSCYFTSGSRLFINSRFEGFNAGNFKRLFLRCHLLEIFIAREKTKDSQKYFYLWTKFSVSILPSIFHKISKIVTLSLTKISNLLLQSTFSQILNDLSSKLWVKFKRKITCTYRSCLSIYFFSSLARYAKTFYGSDTQNATKRTSDRQQNSFLHSLFFPFFCHRLTIAFSRCASRYFEKISASVKRRQEISL